MVCKDNTSKDTFFAVVNNYKESQEIHIQVKNEYVGTLTTNEINDTKQNNKHDNMFNVDANLKHVHTHENDT